MHTSGFRVLLTLTRFPVSFAVTFTAFTALFMATDHMKVSFLIPVAGIFLLASGASALNQYQEWPYDERMERTKRRPLPSRRISTAEALRISLICIVGGMMILLYYSTPVCFALGFFNILWYNGIYTYLKRKSAFAVVPGALTGTIPVLMGWAVAGGQLTDPVALWLALFLFIWQMPHFWLLTLKYGDEYRQAGFPVLNDLFTDRQIKFIVMGWLIAASAVSTLLAHFRIIQHPVVGIFVSAMNMVLLLLLSHQLFLARTLRFRLIFLAANIFMMMVMLSLIADRLVNY